MADFVSHPLYLNRGDNNPEQIITAPHLVWLDERTEKIAGRAPKETIPALMAPTGDRPAAVFCQCPAGAEVLYRHLRGINMVMIPTEYAPSSELASLSVNQQSPTSSFKTVLFRHADASVIAQKLPAMTTVEMARFYGKATRIFFEPHPDWGDGDALLQADRSDGLPKPQLWFLILSPSTMEGVKHARELIPGQQTVGIVRQTLPHNFKLLSNDKLE